MCYLFFNFLDLLKYFYILFKDLIEWYDVRVFGKKIMYDLSEWLVYGF